MAVNPAAFFQVENLIGFILFQVIILCIVFSNSWMMTRMNRHRARGVLPFVSILVPARNEEDNIERCVRSILAQDYTSFELIVLDDHSHDQTLRILRKITHRRLRILQGEQLPRGWSGKNWACHQLSRAARGDVLFFADADTVFMPSSIARIVGVMQGEKADLLSGFPRQELTTLGEKLLVPIFYWAFMSFTPMAASLIWKKASLNRAVGQMMVFRREAYRTIGGHARSKDSVIDDLELARQAGRQGLTCRMMDATRLVSCRMYRNAREAYDGFNKNLFPAFHYAVLPYLFVWIFIGFVYIAPLVWLALQLAAPAAGGPIPGLLFTCIGLALLHWTFLFGRLKLPVWLGFCYPLVVVAYEVMAVASFINNLRRKTTWKGRQVTRPPLRWF